MSNLEDTKESKPTKKQTKRVSKKQAVLAVGLVVVFFGLIFTSWYFYNKYNNLQSDPSKAVSDKNQQESNRVVEKVKAIILIDSTDAPTVARIENPDTLKQNNATFYKNIQKGDYLILYKDRAIIFRESTNQIINIAPIVANNPASQQPTQTENANNSNNR